MCQHSAKEEKCQLCPACVPTDVVVKCHLYGERAKKATVAAHQSGKGFNTIPKKSKILSTTVKDSRQLPILSGVWIFSESWHKQQLSTALNQTDLWEDARCRGDSAVHHTVKDGKQAVQREGLWTQKVITCLEDRQIDINIVLHVSKWNQRRCKSYVRIITFSFFFRKFVFLILPWCWWAETEDVIHLIHSQNHDLGEKVKKTKNPPKKA